AQNFAQLRSSGSTMVVASRLPLASLLPSIRQAMREVNPNQATFRVATMEQVVDASLAQPRVYVWLLTTFAAIGTVLAAAGIYSVIAHLVALRTREFGIRMALGADAGRVVGLVLGRGASLAVLGLVVGTAAAVAATRLLGTILYEVKPTDPLTFTI